MAANHTPLLLPHPQTPKYRNALSLVLVLLFKSHSQVPKKRAQIAGEMKIWGYTPTPPTLPVTLRNGNL